MEIPPSQLWLGICAIVSGLSTAVAGVFLYYNSSKGETINLLKSAVTTLEKRADNSDAKHEECEKDRLFVLGKLAEATGDAELLSRCPRIYSSTCPMMTMEQRAEVLRHRRETESIKLPPA